MKIAFLGDFSGLFKNLKDGLINNNEVIILADGDGFKNIQNDINLGVNGRFKTLKRIYMYYKYIYKLKGYDVVQIINPEFLKLRHEIFTKIILKKIKKNNKKIFLTCAGDDYLYINNCDNLRYSPYMEIEPKSRPHKSKISRNINYFIAKNVDGIIPNLYEYAEPYREFENLKRTIPMPLNLQSVKYNENTVKERIVIFHGLNREAFKGTDYIVKALNKIKIKYNNEVEIVIDGKMPLDQYLKLMEKTNIVIDQCKSYGYGMNALYSMAMGKVVLSGAEGETLKEFGIENSPIINILPDENDIFNKLERLIKNPKSINEIGYKSRRFVEKYHDCNIVAKEYIKVWDN